MSNQTVEVEVAVGRMSGEWQAIWVEVVDTGYEFGDEMREEAEERALEAALGMGWNDVAFTKILYFPSDEEE